ncbi:MAG: AtpZ/AtpI family protein [Bacteroidales bacterium]
MEKQKNKKTDPVKSYARFSGIVFEMLAIIGGGAWAGVKLDESRDGDFPLFTIILSLLAVAIALYVVIKQVINMNK